jgi:hypothetical protein
VIVMMFAFGSAEDWIAFFTALGVSESVLAAAAVTAGLWTNACDVAS